MSDQNELPVVPESKSGGCSLCHCSSGRGVMKAMMYVPVILLVGALGAVAMFPDLADYGYPLIGNPSRTGFSGESACSAAAGMTSCPSSAAFKGSCCSQGISVQMIQESAGGCCPTGRSSVLPAQAESSEPEISAETASVTPDAAPADAIAPLNVVAAEVVTN